MAAPERGLKWWDREVDDHGNPIRADVRQAAHQIWKECCCRVRTILGDEVEAPELMEAAVAHVSRHLDHVGAPPFYPRTDSLLKLHFCQELRRQAGRLGRVQAIGLAAELEEIAPTSNWVEGFNAWLDIEKFRAHLSERSWITFAMRYLGHPWQEICEKLGIAISTAQNCFRQDVREARALLNGNNTDTNTNGKAGKK